MSSKTRYYLEQSVPELEDLLKKGLFTKNEITLIMRKRTNFEHTLNSRGSKTRDYLKYIEFEMNLEKLRAKRYGRLSKVGLIDTTPSISDWSSERRILFIFDRSIKKFPSDLQLWQYYLNYAKERKIFKKIYKIYSELLQLHPTSISSWINAANFEFETVGSAKNARILFQKALRFNKESKKLWLTYTIFELSYISKLINRRKLLGLITEKQQLDNEESGEKAAKDREHDSENNLILLPEFSNDEAKNSLKSLPDADINMLGNPETNPALRGDVALTIFDICFKTLSDLHLSTNESISDFQYQLCLEFIDIFDKFKDLNRFYLQNHVVQHLLKIYGDDCKVVFLDLSTPLRNVSVNDDDFISLLQNSTNKFLKYKKQLDTRAQAQLKNLFIEFLTENFIQENNDKNIKRILNSIIRKL